MLKLKELYYDPNENTSSANRLYEAAKRNDLAALVEHLLFDAILGAVALETLHGVVRCVARRCNAAQDAAREGGRGLCKSWGSRGPLGAAALRSDIRK